MILCVGEILADMIERDEGEGKTFRAFCGGAPFNVAVNAKRAGASVGFIGRVGDDPIGRFLRRQAEKAALAYTEIQTDSQRNTTLAFVALKDGERDFAFHRHDTADYHIDVGNIRLDEPTLSIVHLGSLMLSETEGQKVAKAIVEKTRAAGKRLSFDVNFRKDLYGDFQNAIRAYEPFVTQADIVKFSEEEILEYTGKATLAEAVESVYRKDALLLVTLGAEGSFYRYNEKQGRVPSEKVQPIDTTGAGDAFFGTFLAHVENRAWNEENIKNALIKANKAGAETTRFLGAIQL